MTNISNRRGHRSVFRSRGGGPSVFRYPSTLGHASGVMPIGPGAAHGFMAGVPSGPGGGAALGLAPAGPPPGGPPGGIEVPPGYAPPPSTPPPAALAPGYLPSPYPAAPAGPAYIGVNQPGIVPPPYTPPDLLLKALAKAIYPTRPTGLAEF